MLKERLINTLTIAYIQDVDPYLQGFRAYLPELRRTAILPARNTSRKNRLGEYTWAVIMQERQDDQEIILSQTAVQYFRRLTECFLCAERMDEIKVKRVAHVADDSFVKIAVASENGNNPVQACIQIIPENIKKYTDLKMIFVRYDESLAQYIKNSLYPCPHKAVRKVIYNMSDARKRAIVYVDKKYVALCKGPNGSNVICASKLLGINIIIKESEQEAQ
jgi:transcription antitermination factor NusA-like protein